MFNKRGFTLIELLVVIAIIGILASVVLASLNSARSKGSDAAVKSNLANARAEAEIFYDIGNTYTGVCALTGSSTIGDNVTAALTAAGALPTAYDTLAETCFVSSNGTGWAASVQLVSTDNFWCVDSSGASKDVGATYTISSSDVSC